MKARLAPPLLALVLGVLGVFGSARGQMGAGGGPEIAQKGLRVSAVPAFEGRPQQGESVSVRVTIANGGPDTAGAVVVGDESGAGVVRYPVALPRGARKSLVVLAPATYGSVQVSLQTDRAGFPIPVPMTTANARASALAIGDGSGGLAFLEAATTTKGSGGYKETVQSLAVLYARPEDAPEGEAAYGRTSVVMLLPGSERMSGRSVEALRRYVLRGGHLVAFGGASAPVLLDARFRPMWPFRGLAPREIAVGGARVSAQVPTPTPEAERADVSGLPVLRRPYGVGRVSYVAANPLEGGFATLSNRLRIVERAIDAGRSMEMVRRPWNAGPGMVEPKSNEPRSVVMGSTMGSTRYYPAPSPYGGGTGDPKDPFSLPIPPTGQIGLVLGIYFLVVLPVNFLVLRGFKRLEWAWFTAPALAVLFAGVLFRNAGALYKTGLSKAAQTVVYAVSGGREGLGIGHASLFFPNAAAGPIPIEGAELVSPDLYSNVDPYGYRDASKTRTLDVVQTDRPSVPEYRSSSLEFRDLDYHQTLGLGRGIRIVATGEGPGAAFTVFNGSPYALTGVRAVRGANETLVRAGTDAEIPPGGSARLKPVALKMGATSGFEAIPTTAYRRVPLLVATLGGAPGGPGIGTSVAGRTWTRVLVSGEIGSGEVAR